MISPVAINSPGSNSTALSTVGNDADFDGTTRAAGLSLRNLGFQVMVALLGIALACM